MWRTVALFCVVTGVIWAHKWEGGELLPRSVAVEPKERVPVWCYAGSKRMVERRPSAIRWRPYNVVRYQLFLDWVRLLSRSGTGAQDRAFTGVNQITVRIDSPSVRLLVFDAAAMRIDSAKVNGMRTSVTQPAADTIVVQIPFTVVVGDTLQVEIAYTSLTTRNGGLYLYPKGMFVGVGPAGDSVFVEERLAYTMSQPEDARYWMPCNDAPHDKALADIAVAVPDGFVVASNGWLDTVLVTRSWVPDVPAVRIYQWRDTVPIATYLMVVHASRYAEFRDVYERSDGSRVPLLYFVWPPDMESPDTTGRRYNARYAFRRVPEMMRVYEHLFGRYPFVKYGMAAVQPFGYGGMEHQTMTTVNRAWLRGWSEWGIAHELAHQWLGDLVSCATWKDIWLNEGGATWSEALWLEQLRGPSAYQERMERARGEYLEQRTAVMQMPVYGPPMQLIFFYATTYAKAAWIYHMMRRMVGDSLFFPALRAYMGRYRYGSAETEDFLSSLQEDIPNPPVPWRTFFDQWVYGAGHPVVELLPIVSPLPDGRYWVRCRVRQIQTGDKVPPVFVMPWVLSFYGADGQYGEQRFLSTEREQWVEIVLPFFPDSIRLNGADVLCEYSVAPVSVSGPEGEELRLRVLPHPVRGVGMVEFHLPVAATVGLELFTLTGERIPLYTSFLPAGAYRFPLRQPHLNCAAGLYAVRLWKEGTLAAVTVFQWEP
ncbi:MAG: M1 family metallopeptidase [Bacteroidota bacterium]|nr:M1 family metallopeptidase [Bacteroidota bacterium]